MAAKQLAFESDAQKSILAGVEKLAAAVKKDGVSVAEEIELTDKYENMGAQLVKEAASKTSDVAGDGTTSATVLAEAIYREGLKMIAAGSDPMALTRGIQKGVGRAVEELGRIAEKIDDKDEKEI